MGVSGCNVIGNGYGGSRNVTGDHHVVPPGHSGVYVESSMSWIDDSLLSGNSLTGLSVVRNGFVNLSGSDITLNGQAEQILVEDAHDLQDAETLLSQGLDIRGGVVEGLRPNNLTTLKGGAIRECGPFMNETKETACRGALVREMRRVNETEEELS